MPSTLLHLAFAEEVYRQCFSQDKIPYLNKFYFLCGNLIPDETSDKHLSHYRVPYGITGFFVPVLENAQKDLLKQNNSLNLEAYSQREQKSLNLGLYSHLYLDHYFIKDFLVPSFNWDYNTMKIINPRNNRVWEFNDFFSKNGFYSAYSEFNQLLIEENIVDLSVVDKLPEILPKTGLECFDTRRKITWKEELYQYLAEDVKYVGDIFDYNELMCFLNQTAKKFVDEMN